jgi:hypothetical protein
MDKSLKLAALNAMSLLIAASTLTSLAGCGGGNNPSVEPPSPAPAPAPAPAPVPAPAPAPPPSVKNVDLLPKVINPAVTTSLETHIAINPSPNVTAANELFVFLAGTGALPVAYELILQAGAAKGFHAVGLNYPNPTPVGVICQTTSTDPNCFWNVRREIITGTDYSADVSIGPADAIVTRLDNLLGYLKQNFPDQGWGQYLLSNGTVDWSKVVIGGHSQGGGHAGVMTKLYSMHRACYFDSPADWEIKLAAPAAWESMQNVTAGSAQFGFTHVADPLVPYDQLSVIWPAMQLGAIGTAVSVDSNSPPFADSHILTTSVASPGGNSGTPLHSTTIADIFTPLNPDGSPLFGPVWEYLCFR